MEKLAEVSCYTMMQIGRDKDINTETLQNICFTLNCGVEDIIQIIP